LKSSLAVAGSLAAGPWLAGCAGAPAAPSGTAGTGGTSPSASASKTLRILQPTGQFEAADQLVRQQVDAWAQKNGFTVDVDIVDFRAIPAKIAAALSVQQGPDIMLLTDSDAWLHAHSLVDVTPTVEKLKQQLNGVYESVEVNSYINGKYLAVPFTSYPQAWIYRTDWFEEVGYSKFPETMDEFMDAGTKLKAVGHPVGVSLAANNGDARAFAYSVLWNFGGMEVDETGTPQVRINSAETKAALEWAKQFFDNACDPTGFAWDGGGNNRAYLSKTVSAINNSASVYANARDKDPELGPVTNTAVSPKGPGGGWFYTPARQYAITRWSPHPDAGQDLISYLLQPEQYNPWLTASGGFMNGVYKAYENHPMFEEDPKLKPFQEILSQGRWAGYAGRPDARSAQVWNQDIIVNVFAKVNSGTAIDEAIADAEKQMKAIYE
jgi:multiple sugar transport system substrate-binding protein